MCQQVKAKHQKPAGPLQPLEVAEWKWKHVTMNFVIHLPQTQRRHDALWVIVDRLTKSAHFLAVQMTFTLENSTCCIFVRLSDYMECQSLLNRTGIPDYVTLLEEFPEGHGDAVDDEHCFFFHRPMVSWR